MPEIPKHRFRSFNLRNSPGKSRKQIHPVKLVRNHSASGLEGCSSEIECGHHFFNYRTWNNFAFPVRKHGHPDPTLEQATFLTTHGHIVRSIPDSASYSRHSARQSRFVPAHFTWGSIIAGEENHGVLFETVRTKFGYHSTHRVVDGLDQCQAHSSAIISPIIIMRIIELGKFLVIRIRLLD